MPGLHSEQITNFNAAATKEASFFTGNLNHINEYDPLVVGNGIFIFWLKLPEWLNKELGGEGLFENLTHKFFLGLSGISDIELDYAGMKSAFTGDEDQFVTGVKKNNLDFTLKFNEASGSPLVKAMEAWIFNIRDPQTGIAVYPRKYGMQYATKNHTAELLYVVTRPDADNLGQNNIEFASYWTNVGPVNLPLGHWNSEKGNNEVVVPEFNFKGHIHLGKVVEELAEKILKENYPLMGEGEWDVTDGAHVSGDTIGSEERVDGTVFRSESVEERQSSIY